jgi:hypothetical protein
LCKGLCYNCDEKYVKGHFYRERKLFHMDVIPSVLVEEVSPEEQLEEKDSERTPLVINIVEPTTSMEESIISLHALSSLSTLQTLNQGLH